MKSRGENQELKWVPVIGEFATSGNTVHYTGRIVPPAAATADQTPQPGVGLVLSSAALADGIVTADVSFADITPDTICELAIAHDANASRVLTAGLGSEPWAMFGIREFGGPRSGGHGWWDYRVSGDRKNLRAGQTYELELRLRGASATLVVDGVTVGTAETTSPSGQARHVGVLCKGAHDITVTNFRVSGDKPRAFVVMQFGAEFDDVYDDVVREACKDYDVNVLRADEVSGPGLIVADIIREISTAQLIIADITPANPNVYFEVGYALAMAKPTILLARKGTPLPFDIAGFRVLFYEDTIGGKGRLEEGLRRHLDAILNA